MNKTQTKGRSVHD